MKNPSSNTQADFSEISHMADAIAFYDGSRYVIEESMGYLIRQAQAALHRTIDGKMGELDLTAMQWVPLMLIEHDRGRTAAELSRCNCVESSTMTRMLDRLEAKGLVTRKRSETDRRVINLELTAEGKRLVARVPYLLAESMNQHLSGFSRGEVDSFKSMLRRFAANEPKQS